MQATLWLTLALVVGTAEPLLLKRLPSPHDVHQLFREWAKDPRSSIENLRKRLEKDARSRTATQRAPR